MVDDDINSRLEQLERRVESLESRIASRLKRLEEELSLLRTKVGQLPVSEKTKDILDGIEEARQELRELSAEGERQDG